MQNKYTEKQKLARQLYWELDEIRAAQRKLGVFKLKNPIQCGWTKQFKIRSDILRGSDGRRYLEILPFVQNHQVSRTTNFDGRTVLELNTISLNKKKLIKWPEFYWTKYFVLTDEKRGYYTGVEYKHNKCFAIKHSWVFEYEIVPNFITFLPIIDPALESREKEIHNKIQKNNLWPVIDKHLFGNAGHRDEWDLNVVKNREILKELEKEIREEVIF